MTELNLFSGIGCIALAMQESGFQTVAFAEIDRFPSRVLKYRFPEIPNLGDVRGINGAQWRGVDVVTFGSPCQDLSVAGKRKGFKGQRSALFFEAVRIVRESRTRFAFWENVGGALSSRRGRDFGAALDALAECGAMDIGWRVLDSQFTGVPQRRRRVFVVADFRGRRAAKVLSLTESLRGHLEARGQAQEDVAGCLGGGAAGGGWRDDLDRATFIPIQEVGKRTGKSSSEVRHGAGVGEPGDPMFTLGADSRHAVAYQCQGSNVGEMGTLRAGNGNSTGGVPFLLQSPALVARDAKGTDSDATDALIFDAQQVTNPDHRVAYSPGRPSPPLTGNRMHVAHSLRGDGFDASEDGTGRGTPLVPMGCDLQNAALSERCGTLDSEGPARTNRGHGVLGAMGVRRLTPLEAERLMDMPEGWTDIPGAKDGPRYRGLGNGAVRRVVRGIGERMAAVLRPSVAEPSRGQR